MAASWPLLNPEDRAMPRSIALFALPIVVLSSATIEAATRTWPGPAPCNSTLQACIDNAVDGDRIEVQTTSPIDENLLLHDRSLTLTSSPLIEARFADGRSINVSSTVSAGNLVVNLSRLRLHNGYARLRYLGIGTATFDVRHLVLEGTATGTPAFIHVGAGVGATVSANVQENRVDGAPASLNAGLIELSAIGGTLNAYAAYNRVSRIVSAADHGAGIFVDIAPLSGQPGGGTLRVFGNEIRGNFGRGGLFFSEGLFATTVSHYTALAFNNAIICNGEFPRGISFTVAQGTIAAQAINNTVSGCREGISALRWNGGSLDARINGVIGNNVVRATYRGLSFTSDLTTGLVNDYNLINAPGNIATLGPHTISTDARLVTSAAPRLRDGSPAIGAGDGAMLANALIDAGLPALDADGLRRVKGGTVDIGAYEWGDTSLLHRVSTTNTGGHITRIDHPHSNGQPGSLVFPTRVYGASGPGSIEPFGVYYAPSTARWTIYNESIAPVLPNLRWGVFAPASGSGAFTHIGNAGNTSAWHTQIDNGATDGYAERIVLVAHNWSAAANYNTHLTGIYWSGSGSAGRWHIANLDQTNLPLPIGFNVYAQTASPNAFRVAAIPGAQRVELNHPLINDIACATVHVTRVVNPASPGPAGSFDLDFATSTGRWAIYSVSPFPAGTAFNVLIDPAQIFVCTDSIFTDGFDD